MKQKRNPLTWRWDITWEKQSGVSFKIEIVDSLPLSWEEGVIYIVKGGIYSDMYVRDWVQFIKIGTTQLTEQVQSDWLEQDDTKPSFILNKPELATVAYTGDYNDLENQPEEPEVNDATVNINVNWETQSFTLNQEEDVDIDITVPTKTSDLENDVPFATVSQIPTKTSDLENDSWYITKDVNDLTHYTKTIDLAPVALSNDYEDLNNKPTIPTKVSDLENDTGFITNTVNNLTNYYKKTETYTQAEVDALLAWISSLRVEVVSELPNPGEFGVIYLVESETPGVYNQYILTELPNTYVMVGNTNVDLTNYFNKVTDTADNINDGVNKVIMTTWERVNLSHQSGYNTGDETKATIQSKMWPASATNDWYLKKEDWVEFDDKADYDDFVWVDASGWTIYINNPSTEITTGSNVTVNVWPSVRSGLVYILRVNATNDMHINLWTWISNENGTDLNVPAGKTKNFVMLASSATTLEMQGIDLAGYVKATDLANVAFSGDYNDLSNKPSIPTPETPGNWRLRIYVDDELAWTFRANQTSNTDIDIDTTGWFTGNKIYSTIVEVNPAIHPQWVNINHWLGQRPKFVDIEWYSDFKKDSQGRNQVSRYMASWQNWQLKVLGSLIHLSDGTLWWYVDPITEENFPLVITVWASVINVDSSLYSKVRITAYL